MKEILKPNGFLTPSELTRRSLLIQHGIPGTKEENGMKIRICNTYFDSFASFDKKFDELLDMTDIDPNQHIDAIRAMCQWFESAEWEDMDKITKRLTRLLNSQDADKLKKMLSDFFADIEEGTKAKKFSTQKIRTLFRYHFGVKFESERIQTKTYLF